MYIPFRKKKIYAKFVCAFLICSVLPDGIWTQLIVKRSLDKKNELGLEDYDISNLQNILNEKNIPAGIKVLSHGKLTTVVQKILYKHLKKSKFSIRNVSWYHYIEIKEKQNQEWNS